MKTDLLWWKYFLSRWNEIKFLKRVETRREFALWTNAFDEYNMKDYFVFRFELSMSSANNMQRITFKTLSWVTSSKLSLYISRNTFVHISKKTFSHNSRNTSLHNSRKTSFHNSRKTSLYNSRKTFLHNSRKTFLYNSRKTSLYNSKKTFLHNSRKTFLYNSKKTFLYNSRKTFLHNSRNIFLNQSRDNSRLWRKLSLIFSSDSFFQFKDIFFKSLNNANSMTTSRNIFESSLKKKILDYVFFVRFSSRMRLLHINFKKMQAMLWALKIWIHTFAEKKIILYYDN
jgi:hypothetical protein